MKCGDKVLFCAPHNVNEFDHGLEPYQTVEAVVTQVMLWGDPCWYEVTYDGGREISAHRKELRAL